MSVKLVGLGITSSAAPGADPLGDALAAEALGFDFVSTSDHPVGTQPSYETGTLLTWIAARTTRIAVASRVFGVPFRHPAMLAKAAESLDRLAGGRLILGLGGGHSDEEIATLGLPPLSPRQKVDGLAAAITTMRTVWTGRQFAPAAARPIPIWLGTYGPRALAVTGRHADGWIPSLGFAPPQRIPEMLDRIRTASVAAGRPADAVQAIYNVQVRFDARGGLGSDRLGSDGVVGGRPGEVAEQLRELTELGFSGFSLSPERPADVPVLGEEVLPALRA